MSSSTRIRFLLDENVRKELAAFLSKRKVDFTLATKRAPDNAHARASLAEERAVVTNDHDFMYMCQGDVFGVVLLLLPQNDPNLLLKRFGEMLDECSEYKDHAVLLTPSGWRAEPLPIRFPPRKVS